MFFKNFKFSFLLLSLIFSVFLVGCSSDSDSKVDSSSKTETETESKPKKSDSVSIEKLPLDVTKLHLEKQGDLYNFSELDSKTQVSSVKDLSSSDYSDWLRRFQQSYESPDEIMEKLKYGVGEFKGSGRYIFKDNLNVLILLDSSGSMGKLINGESQMDIAKRALKDFLSSLPSEANVGLRVYGNKGKGIDSDKSLSCSSSDLVYGLTTYNSSDFTNSLNSVKPSGWTPTDLALKKASDDLKGKNSESNTNIIYLVSDGISTCDDDPVKTAKELYESDLKPVINVIGFNVDAKAKSQLEEVAKVTNGIYTDVNNYSALKAELDEVEKVAQEWKKWLATLDKELESNSKLNLLEIYNYAARLQQNVVKYNNEVSIGLDVALENKVITKDEFNILSSTHKKYVDELTLKTSKLREDLRNVSDENLNNTLKEIESLIYGN